MSITLLKESGKRRLPKGGFLYHYEIRISTHHPTLGRQQRKRRAWLPSAKEAAALERAMLEGATKEIQTGVTWSEAWKLFQEVGPSRSPGHLENMAFDIACLTDVVGDIPVEATALSDFIRAIDARRLVSGRAAQKLRSTAHRIAKWLISRGAIQDAPCLRAQNPEHHASVRQNATIEEWKSVAEFMAQPTKSARTPDRSRMIPIWMALGLTGSRFSALANSTPSNVRSGYLAVRLKGGRLHHYLITPALDPWIDTSGEYLFPNEAGTPWTPSTYRCALTRLWKSHPDCPHITPHQLRHMVATLLADMGMSADVIQASLGHSSRKSSESYIHHTQEMADRALTQLTHLLQDDPIDTPLPTMKITDFGEIAECPCCGNRIQIERVDCIIT